MPLDRAVRRVAEARPDGHYVAVGSRQRWRIAVGIADELTVSDISGVDPWEQIRRAVRARPGRPAFGYVCFDMCCARFAYRHRSDSLPFAHLIWPKAEVVGSPQGVRLSGDAEAVASLRNTFENAPARVAQDSTPSIVPQLFDADGFEPTNIDDPDSFHSVLRRALDRVSAGDAYKVIVRRERKIPSRLDPADALAAISTTAGARQFAISLPGLSAVGTSPAQLASIEGGVLTSEALAGTLPRLLWDVDEAAARDKLLQNAKEVHEHALTARQVLDDVREVAAPGTAVLTEFLRVAQFPTTWHIATHASCRLREGADEIDGLAAVFPGVTCTGVPREKAIALISDLESTPRGFYGGCVGYFDGDGGADWAISLRGVTDTGDGATFHAGTAVGLFSDIEAESEESFQKMRTMLSKLCRV